MNDAAYLVVFWGICVNRDCFGNIVDCMWKASIRHFLLLELNKHILKPVFKFWKLRIWDKLFKLDKQPARKPKKVENIKHFNIPESTIMMVTCCVDKSQQYPLQQIIHTKSNHSWAFVCDVDGWRLYKDDLM